MESETSCFNTCALIHYVRAKRPENLHLLWEPLKGKIAEGEDPERFLGDPKNRVSIEVCRDIMEQAKKATSDDMAVYKAAFGHGRPREGSGTQQRSISAFSGPRQAIRKAQEMNGRLLGGKRIEIVSVSDTHALVRLHWSKELPLTRDFCLFAKGTYQAIPTMFHLSPARLWERVCFFQGGPYCEYEMWWDKEPLSKISRLMPALRKSVFRSPVRRITKGEIQTSVQDQGTATPHERASNEVVDQNRMAFPPSGVDRPAPRKPRPEGRGQGELYKNGNLPYRGAPPGRVGRLHSQGKGTQVAGTVQPTAKEAASEAPRTVQSQGGKIRHELNDIFTDIQGRVSLMLMDMDARHPHFEHLKGIEGMIQQGAKLTKPFLDFANDSQDEVEVPQLNQEKATREPGWNRELMRGTETVLLVDDEDMLVDIGRQMLEALGYHVMVARTGREAVEIYEKNQDSIDMVVLDMIMPDMGGAQACDRMKEINPDIKILVSSGYSIEGEVRQTLARGCNGLIQKPFSLKQLSEKVRGILDR
jgi:CheY-like chemotaxis protein